eukprot:CAMPEP_0179007150 /NCGR_PEP_ID=MMETSP0795-20121207/14983_1 /TAXON_ID=88552 /ORGANISM="Amoebophrya sp., Strain Ameob2" /LENGTH=1529 /DNA_ID=CAMNT_0020702057 /DNA_START=102 /DNA_END=4691 /DNA_ORIENTATION=+
MSPRTSASQAPNPLPTAPLPAVGSSWGTADADPIPTGPPGIAPGAPMGDAPALPLSSAPGTMPPGSVMGMPPGGVVGGAVPSGRMSQGGSASSHQTPSGGPQMQMMASTTQRGPALAPQELFVPTGQAPSFAPAHMQQMQQENMNSHTGAAGGTAPLQEPGYGGPPTADPRNFVQQRSKDGSEPGASNDGGAHKTSGGEPTESEVDRIVSNLPESELDGVTLLSSIEQAVLTALEQGNYDRVEKLSAMSHRLSNSMRAASSENRGGPDHVPLAEIDPAATGGGRASGEASSSVQPEVAGAARDEGDIDGGFVDGFPNLFADEGSGNGGVPGGRSRSAKEKSPKKKKRKSSANKTGAGSVEEGDQVGATAAPAGPGAEGAATSKTNSNTSDNFPTNFFDITSEAGTIEPEGGVGSAANKGGASSSAAAENDDDDDHIGFQWASRSLANLDARNGRAAAGGRGPRARPEGEGLPDGQDGAGPTGERMVDPEAAAGDLIDQMMDRTATEAAATTLDDLKQQRRASSTAADGGASAGAAHLAPGQGHTPQPAVGGGLRPAAPTGVPSSDGIVFIDGGVLMQPPAQDPGTASGLPPGYSALPTGSVQAAGPTSRASAGGGAAAPLPQGQGHSEQAPSAAKPGGGPLGTPDTQSVQSFDLRWHPDVLLKWEKKETAYKTQIAEQQRKLKNEQQNVKVLCQQLQASSSEVKRIRKEHSEATASMSKQYNDLSEQYLQLQASYLKLLEQHEELTNKSEAREEVLSETRERLFLEKERVANMVNEVEEKRLIYDTMQRRLADARSVQKTAEQELRELHEILDATATSVVGGSIQVRASQPGWQSIASPTMADKGDELASALCEESTAAMKKTITETRPLHPARPEGVLVEALPLGLLAAELPQLRERTKEHFLNLMVHSTGPIYEDHRLQLSCSVDGGRLRFAAWNKSASAQILDVELAVSAQGVSLPHYLRQRSLHSFAGSGAEANAASGKPFQNDAALNRGPPPESDAQLSDFVKGPWRSSSRPPSTSVIGNDSAASSKTRIVFPRQHAVASVKSTTNRIAIGQLPGDLHEATVASVPHIYPKETQQLEVRLSGFGATTSSSSTAQPLVENLARPGTPFLEFCYATSDDVSYYFRLRFPLHAIRFGMRQLELPSPAFFSRWTSMEFVENEANFVGRAREDFYQQHEPTATRIARSFSFSKLHFLKCCELGGLLKALPPHITAPEEVQERSGKLAPEDPSKGPTTAAVESPCSSAATATSGRRRFADSYKLLLSGVVRRATSSPEVLVEAELDGSGQGLPEVRVLVRSTQLAISRAVAAALSDVLLSEATSTVTPVTTVSSTLSNKENAAPGFHSQQQPKQLAAQLGPKEKELRQGTGATAELEAGGGGKTTMKNEDAVSVLAKKHERRLFAATSLEEAFALRPTPTLDYLAQPDLFSAYPASKELHEAAALRNAPETGGWTSTRSEALLAKIQRRQRDYVVDKLLGKSEGAQGLHHASGGGAETAMQRRGKGEPHFFPRTAGSRFEYQPNGARNGR